MNDPRYILYTTQAMEEAFAPATHLHQMLAFEAALARAEARAGVIPAAAAAAITSACHHHDLDSAALYREAAVAGTPAIPLVRMLSERVAPEGRAYVHWGATSQDAIDTATVLQMRAGLVLLEGDLLRLAESCVTLADRHRRTVMAGRTLLQQALPIPFGLKAARWLALVTRQVWALRERRQTLALQFGGATGTLAALGERGLQVAELLAAELTLLLPDLPWHAERDRVATIAAALGVTAGSMAKIAQDLALLAQTEVGEVSEAHAPGKGASSTMPHKRNPVDATLALAAARLALGQVPVILMAMTQEHERGVGGWQAEWVAIPDLFRFTGGAVAHVAQAVAGLQVDTQRMRLNLEQEGDLMMAEAVSLALAAPMGRSEAQHTVQAACRRAIENDRSLHQTLLDDAQVRALLSPEALERLLAPANYLGSADALIDRALEGYRALTGGGA